MQRLHVYYDMKLVTFGINEERNAIVQFPIVIQPYKQQLILYQIGTVPVPIIDLNTKAYLYTHSQADRPYITLNSETCISLKHQKLRTCKTSWL